MTETRDIVTERCLWRWFEHSDDLLFGLVVCVYLYFRWYL